MARGDKAVWTVLVIAAVLGIAPAVSSSQARCPLDLPSQRLDRAFDSVTEKCGVDIWPSSKADLERYTAPAIRGTYDVTEALDHLLAGTPLDYRVEVGGYRVCRADACGIPEVLVKGGRSLNVDVARDETGTGNYRVFQRADIERSASSNVAEFLRTEIPGSVPLAEPAGAYSVSSRGHGFNARGLPVLFLVDGRRQPVASLSGDEEQPDIINISLSEVQRIEVLTGSASARYGADAVGGVVNIVKRHAEGGTDLGVRAEQLAGASSGAQEIRGQKSFEFGDDRWVSGSALYSKRDAVLAADRDTLARGRKWMAYHNPAALMTLPLPNVASQANARAIGGSALVLGGSFPIGTLDPSLRLGSSDSSLITQGEYATGFAPSAQTLGGGRATFRPGIETYSFDVGGKWSFTSRITGSINVGYSESEQVGLVSALDELTRTLYVPSSALPEVLQSDAIVAVSSIAGDGKMTREDSLFRASAGLIFELPTGGHLRWDYSWASADAVLTRPVFRSSAEEVAAALLRRFNEQLSAGELGIDLQFFSTPTFRNTLNELSLSYSGSLWSHPLMMVLAHSSETIVNAADVSPEIDPAARAGPMELGSPERTKEVYSLGGEVEVLIHGRRDKLDSHPLTVSLGVRGDVFRYGAPPQVDGVLGAPIRFHALSGALSLRFFATERLQLRGDCSTGFLPPRLSALTLPRTATASYPQLIDPLRGGEPLGEFQLTSGGNPELSPEHSLACGGGFVFEGGQHRTLRFSAIYSWLRRRDVVLTPAELFFADPMAFFMDSPDQVTRGAAEPGDPFGVGRIERVNTQSRNIAEQVVESIDVGMGWNKQFQAGGSLDLSTLIAFTPTFIKKTSRSAPSRNDAGWGATSPTRYALTASAMYQWGHWQLGTTLRYVPEYEVSRDPNVVLSQGARTVKDRAFADLIASYALPGQSGGWEVRFDARNILRERPAYDVLGPDAASLYSRDELPSYSLSVRKAF